MGNPFLLATDFTPTVTFGLISGVHRYQYPSGTLLEYTDCIQIDTSINPGNSGGPLFNMDGELIGINGRGSFEKRGRVNSGVGYAISINQIKNFLGQLKAGLDTDHASLGATRRNAIRKTGRVNNMIVKLHHRVGRQAARSGHRRSSWFRSPAGRLQRQPVQERAGAVSARAGGCRWSYRREKQSKEKREILVRLAWACSVKNSMIGNAAAAAARSADRGHNRQAIAGIEVLRGQARLRQLLLQQARTG